VPVIYGIVKQNKEFINAYSEPGRELARRIHENRPNVKCLFMSGYTADIIAHHGIIDDEVHFVQKPIMYLSLAGKVRATLDS
jgi:two-component system, cell cycle sensor histidine kinase and response regulator CckA